MVAERTLAIYRQVRPELGERPNCAQVDTLAAVTDLHDEPATEEQVAAAAATAGCCTGSNGLAGVVGER